MPGHVDGISGAEMLKRLREQLAQQDLQVESGEIVGLSREAEHFHTRVRGGVTNSRVSARRLLLATGVADRVPALPGLDAMRHMDLLRQCPICDAHEFRNQRIAVLGWTTDDEHARSQAAFLAHYSPDVALGGLQPFNAATTEGEVVTTDGERSFQVLGYPVMGVRAREGRPQLMLHGDGIHECDIIYSAFGNTPRATLATEMGALADDKGALQVDAHGLTSVPGLYAAGDVVSALDQIAMAKGHGATTAAAIHDSL